MIEDEGSVRDVVLRYLRREGYATVEAADGEEGQARFDETHPDLVILDLMLPKLDGLSLCRWIRQRDDTPIIVLTARGEEADRIVGLELGADDYITKPFSPRELVARVRSVLRRAAPSPGNADARLVFDGLEIDPGAREVHREGDRIRLTAREFDMLLLLASHPRQVFTRDQMMERIWGFNSALDTGTVTVHIRRLREKIERVPSRPTFIETVWGVGYRFVS